MSVKHGLKINLHMHTTESDGRKTPEEAAEIYRKQGYDIVAITDHWKYRSSGELNGLRIISGAEYNVGGNDAVKGVYHILGIGCSESPKITRDDHPQKVIDEILRSGGMPILAHPCWSINTPENVSNLYGLEATEIFNSVSDAHESGRPYSGDFVDASACKSIIYPLLATDDTHYYDGTDETKSWIVLEGDQGMSDSQILDAIRAGKFYATQGPEVHIKRLNDKVVIDCSPAVRVTFYSNIVYAEGHCCRGTDITHAELKISEGERFIRAEIIDKYGKKAWTNIIEL